MRPPCDGCIDLVQFVSNRCLFSLVYCIHTECIPPTEKTIEFPELLRSSGIGKSALIAHDLHLLAILDDIKEDQFASGNSIGTYSAY